ncbi:MAG TPA: hypothetical protein DCF33_18330 [Saprospirales bacterium]|nr:hypothetical protein [Saprospirales bacterium]
MRFFHLLALLFLCHKVASQSVHGFVRELGSLEPLIGATVYDTVSNTRTMTNEFGFFSMTVKGREVIFLKANYPHYVSAIVPVSTLNRDTAVVILLEPLSLNEVVVSGSSKKGPPPLGVATITREKLLSIPSIGGVPDLLRAMGTLPGVSTGGELFTGMLVRGGNDDQNLHLLDGAPIYGTTHLLNLVSLYNAEAIKKAQLYKGLFPARFGGRASSVLDVHFREGNKEKWQGNVGLGILNSSFLAEGPLGKSKKTSLLIAGRATYLDLFKLKQKREIAQQQNGYHNFSNFGFYDINAKLNREWGQKHKMSLNFYYGSDRQNSIDQNIFVGFKSNHFADISTANQQLSNLSVCARYSNVLSDRAFFYVTSSFNQYVNSIEESTRSYGNNDSLFIGNIVKDQHLRYRGAGIQKFEGKNLANRAAIDIRWNETHLLRLGWEGILHRLMPGDFSRQVTVRSETGQNNVDQSDRVVNNSQTLFENALYLEDDIKPHGQRLSLLPGIRLSHFSAASRWAFDPRLGVEYKVSERWSVSAGLGRVTQFLHTLNGELNRFDKQIWIGSDQDFPPQISYMATAGVSTSLENAKSVLSVEFFHRRMNNLVTFRFNPDNIYAYADWKQNMYGKGRGKSTGIDLYWETTLSAIQASAAYTLSWNERQYPDLNGGAWFPAKYDRRHDLKLTASYVPRRSKWSFGATWFYNTGHRYTLPVGTASASPVFGGFPVFGQINNVRMPAYHRLDLLAKWTNTPEKGFIKSYSFSFDIMNAYNRLNPYGLVVRTESYIAPDGRQLEKQVVKGVAILPILPSISFKANF